ncbi:hypothetical protein GYMLUDRAFT_246831 [Collybiopsis luxurians FD-317 M1]|uniref:Integrase zinc-binding domain-containing protein n=1 Tax=Collybiopsis luxurians FD-317 M1 TaxID=944289 RepID=A0A0D0B2V3_9AGAR|nr:hypothetical protein GYMLUDRAFT_246831 [Collybiopsis luxurians FD-317 M1]
MASQTRMRIPSQELAQLQLPLKPSDLPSREDFVKIEAHLAAKAAQSSRKPFSQHEWEEVRCMLTRFPQCKAHSYYRKFDLVARESVLDGNDDLWVPLSSTRAPVLLYEGRVAVPEDLLYDVLCYCHSKAGHGDMARTKAIVKRHYVFVGATAIREFIEACPGCAAQQASKEDASPLVSNSLAQTEQVISLNNSFDLLSTTNKTQDEELAFLSVSNPFTFSNLVLEDTEPQIDIGDLPAPPPLFSRMSTASQSSRGSLQSLPMSREVSLFQGIPNGWQFRDFQSYADAHKDFLRHRDEMMTEQEQLEPEKIQKRPRVPSIAPLSTSNSSNAVVAEQIELDDVEGPARIQMVKLVPQSDSIVQCRKTRRGTVVL